jgi:type I restriction enzyme M protein
MFEQALKNIDDALWKEAECTTELDYTGADLALTGDDLRDFVNGKLFPYPHMFKQKATGSNTIEYKIGEIPGGILARIATGPRRGYVSNLCLQYVSRSGALRARPHKR